MKVGIDASAMLIKHKNGYENYVTPFIQALAGLSGEELEGVDITLYFYAGNVLADQSLLGETLSQLRRFTCRVHQLKQGYPWVLSWWTRRDRLDLIHLPVYMYETPLRCKVLTTFHDACSRKSAIAGDVGSEPEGLKAMIDTQLKISDYYLAVSESTKADMQSLYAIPAAKIHVAQHGISPEFRADEAMAEVVRWVYDLSQYILSVNAIQGNKNHVRLLRAFALLKEKYALPHTLVLVGRDGWGSEDTYQELERLKLGRAVRRLGYVPQDHINGLYTGADLVVNASMCEGFGFPILEGLACGAVIAAARATSLPEAGGQAVTYFDPYDVENMAEVIYQALTDQALRQKLRLVAPEQVKKFSWQATALKTVAVYRDAGSLP